MRRLATGACLLGIAVLVVMWAVSKVRPYGITIDTSGRRFDLAKSEGLLLEVIASRGGFYLGSEGWGFGYFPFLNLIIPLAIYPAIVAWKTWRRRRSRRGFEVDCSASTPRDTTRWGTGAR